MWLPPIDEIADHPDVLWRVAFIIHVMWVYSPAGFGFHPVMCFNPHPHDPTDSASEIDSFNLLLNLLNVENV